MNEHRPQSVRLAAMADLHYMRQMRATLVPTLEEAAAAAEVLLLCGDLTHHGLAEEAAALAKDAVPLRIPILAVLGNHDHHSDQQDEIKRVLADSPITVLDGDATKVAGIGFAGTKGFASGFGRRMLEPWGESVVKSFAREAVDEALKLESALARLAGGPLVVLLHYSPIQATVEGEPPEIYAFLGSSRLEDPLNRYQVSAAFHGHAHNGRPEGRTTAGVPVYNVSLPMLRSLHPQGPHYRVVEVAVPAAAAVREPGSTAAP